jgi:hypothetical protein
VRRHKTKPLQAVNFASLPLVYIRVMLVFLLAKDAAVFEAGMQRRDSARDA